MPLSSACGCFSRPRSCFSAACFCAYLVYRSWYYNEFAAGSRSIDIWLGTINTAVLICSSLTVALGVRAAQMGKRKLLVILLLLTIVFGLGFPWNQRRRVVSEI